MSASRTVPPSRQPSVGLIRALFERRVPHAVGVYAGASWGLIEFTDAIIVERLLFSEHYVTLVLWAMPLLLPSVIMLAWFHGKPGRDRDGLARTEKIGIPANLTLCGMVLWAGFAGEDLGRMTTAVSTTDEDGQAVEREIVKPAFRKSVALFPFDLGPGVGEDDAWLAYSMPLALELDLMADDFFIAKGGLLDRNEALFRDRLAQRGFADLLGVPLTLKREVGKEVHAEFLAEGEIDRNGGLYRAVLRVYGVEDGSLEGETLHEGTDLLRLVDEVSVSVKRAVGIPAREGVEDIPVRQRLSDDDAAVEEVYRGLEAAFIKADFAAAIALTTAATARDPTFASAQYVLSLYLQFAGQRAAAVARMQTVIEHEYRFPERVRLAARGDYYALLEDWERMTAVHKMWVDLSPDNLLALVNYKESLDILGDREGVLATLEAMRTLDPRNGDLLQQIARVHEEMGNDEQALRARIDYVDRFPEDAGAYASLAALQQRLGDYVSARDNLDGAILLEPLSAALAGQLAALELDAGNYADAWANYERALEAARTPEQMADARLGMAKYHLRRGEAVLAAEATEMLPEEASGSTGPLEVSNVMADFLVDVFFDGGHAKYLMAVAETANDPAIAQLAMALAMVGSEGPEAVRERYEAARRRFGTEGDDAVDPTLPRFSGPFAERAGDYASAAELYRRVMALDGTMDHHRDLGRVLRLAGRLDESEAELTEALRLVPGDPKRHLEMALLLEVRDDLAGAVEHLGRALAAWENADEDYEPARRARAKLEEFERRRASGPP